MANTKTKIKVAFFDFTSCEGCQVELTNLGPKAFLGLLEHLEFVEFREVMSEKTSEPIDIAFIEGSFTREVDRARLLTIRQRAKTVISYGACASTGGINALKNHMPDYAKTVYGQSAYMSHLASQDALPISAAIHVDYKIHGCPMDKAEFIKIVSSLIHAKEPVIPNHPVCVECKLNQTVCRYQKNDHCLGIVARAGCGAPCTAHGIPCEACRGFIDQPNQDALVKVLVEKGGLSLDRALQKSRMFTANLRSDAHVKKH